MSHTLTPVRLRLSRRKGFDLQAVSLATNGLPAVNVARPSRYGNPWSIQDAADVFDCSRQTAREHAVAWFREWINLPNDGEALDDLGAFGGTRVQHARLLAALPDLRGKNVACFCAVGQACHGDILLALAARPVCDDPSPPDAGRADGDQPCP